MNQINKHNYEAYLLDYSEGVLPAEEVAELLLFIEKNPDLGIDLSDFDLTYLPPSNESLDDKSYIKNFPRIEELVIGHTESVLSKKEQTELEQFEQNFKRVSELKTEYSATILPLESIEFPNKSSLKQSRVIPLYWISAVAAAIFIGFLLTLNLDSNENGGYATSSKFGEIDKIEIVVPKNDNVAIGEIDTLNNSPVNNIKTPIDEGDSNLANVDDKQNLVKPNSISPTDSSATKDSLPLVPEQVIIQKDDIALVDKDTIVNPKEDNSQDIAYEEPNSLTVKDYLKIKTKEIILKEENPSLAPIKGKELLASLAENINAKTKMEVAYQNEEVDRKKVTKFKLGKIEFYKSSSK